MQAIKAVSRNILSYHKFIRDREKQQGVQFTCNQSNEGDYPKQQNSLRCEVYSSNAKSEPASLHAVNNMYEYQSNHWK